MGTQMNTFDAASYWEDRLKQNPGVRGIGHTDLGAQYNQWLYKIRRTVFFRTLRALRTDWASKHVLDIGSGTGFYIRLWKELGVRSVRGSDLTNIAVSRLREKLPNENVFRFDIGGSVPLEEPGRYEVVSAFDVFFHIVDDARYERAIQNVSNLLTPGGLFVFSDLFLHGETLRMEHVVCRPLEEVTRILERAGFEIVTRVPMFVVMAQPLDTASACVRFLWKLMTYPVRKSEAVGFVLGAILAPIETELTRVLRESPTTEIMVCRKVNL